MSRVYRATVTNLKLQKLLFYTDGWHDALYGEALFGEKPRTWSRRALDRQLATTDSAGCQQ